MLSKTTGCRNRAMIIVDDNGKAHSSFEVNNGTSSEKSTTKEKDLGRRILLP
jgi:hypothetical protein